MTLTTSDSKVFQKSVDEIIEDAYEDALGEPISGHEAESARRALNLLLTELVNKKIPLHTITEKQVSLEQGVVEYSLGDILDVVGESGIISYGGKDYPMDRLPLLQYNKITDKTREERPSSFTVDREYDQVKIKVYPAPNDTTSYFFKCLVSEHFDTVTASHQLIQTPRRFLPVIVAGLSYKLSLKRAGIPQNRRLELKQNYAELLRDALEEDGERTDLEMIPTNYKRRF